MQMWKVKDDGRRTDDGQRMITIVHLSLRLRCTKNEFMIRVITEKRKSWYMYSVFHAKLKNGVCLWNTNAPGGNKVQNLPVLVLRSWSRSQGNLPWSHLKGFHKLSMHAKYEQWWIKTVHFRGVTQSARSATGGGCRWGFGVLQREFVFKWMQMVHSEPIFCRLCVDFYPKCRAIFAFKTPIPIHVMRENFHLSCIGSRGFLTYYNGVVGAYPRTFLNERP